MLSIQRRFEIDAGHRVLLHESKCAHPHGHRYGIVVTAEALAQKAQERGGLVGPFEGGLDELGRVIDFSVIKSLLGVWLDENWDHSFLVFEKDETLLTFLEANGFRRYVLPVNPTAENMAAHLLYVVCPVLFAGTRVQITEVTIHETPNCSAKATFGSSL